MSTPATTRPANERLGRIALIAILVVQLIVGYEWFVSGLTKIVRGGFPAGLAGELSEKSEGAAGWYKSFLDGSVIPNASVFGYLIEIGELLVGITLIAAALVWLLRWERLPQIPGRLRPKERGQPHLSQPATVCGPGLMPALRSESTLNSNVEASSQPVDHKK